MALRPFLLPLAKLVLACQHVNLRLALKAVSRVAVLNKDRRGVGGAGLATINGAPWDFGRETPSINVEVLREVHGEVGGWGVSLAGSEGEIVSDASPPSFSADGCLLGNPMSLKLNGLWPTPKAEPKSWADPGLRSPHPQCPWPKAMIWGCIAARGEDRSMMVGRGHGAYEERTQKTQESRNVEQPPPLRVDREAGE